MKKNTKNNYPQSGCRTGIFGFASLFLAILLTICSQFISIIWLRWFMISLACISALAPTIIQMIIVRHRFGIGTIYTLFQKMGQNPCLEGNEIKWNFKGKLNVIRLGNGNQLQISREYPVQDEIVSSFIKAASVTMSEIFSAKVGIRKDNDDNSIYFSTEMLCSSIKEFTKLLPETVDILDAAEDRQKVNLQEIASSEMDFQKRHRIGFYIGDDCKKSNDENTKE